MIMNSVLDWNDNLIGRDFYTKLAFNKCQFLARLLSFQYLWSSLVLILVQAGTSQLKIWEIAILLLIFSDLLLSSVCRELGDNKLTIIPDVSKNVKLEKLLVQYE